MKLNYDVMEKIKITPRVQKLRDMLFEKMPEIESDRAVIVTDIYMSTENLPVIKRRSRDCFPRGDDFPRCLHHHIFYSL